jgi:hypothetical protein
MIRTQISLSALEYNLVKKEAKRSGLSIAELLRRSLRTMLPVNPKKPWMQFAGLVSSGNPNSSTEIDDIIYGHKD